MRQKLIHNEPLVRVLALAIVIMSTDGILDVIISQRTIATNGNDFTTVEN